VTAFLLDERAGDSLVLFERVSFTAANGHSERWLQERLFASPALLPMVEMFGYGESFVPLCRERGSGINGTANRHKEGATRSKARE
jgi:hypothetical protein